MTSSSPPVPRIAVILGIAGIAPQIWALLATFNETNRYVGLAAGYFYAALIFSFLGGLWWGVASTREDAPEWLYVAAIVPSLIAFSTGIPWMTGAPWPGPSLAVLGTGILAAPLVDWVIFKAGFINAGVLRLRFGLSLALGGLTLLLAVR